MGLMLTSLLVAQGRNVTLADPHAERRAQAERLGATASEEHLTNRHELVFEAVGRPEAWRAAAAAAAPGGVVVLVGGCPTGTEVSFQTGPLHYEELELRGSFHHSPDEVDEALSVLAADETLWRTLRGPTISLEELPDALGAPNRGPAKKPVVDGRDRRYAHELEVLDDPPRVADRLAVDHEHRHPSLTGERLDLRPPRSALRNLDLLEREPVALQCARDPSARAQPVGRRRAAIERRH